MPLAPPPPTNQTVDSRQFRDWFYSIYALLGKPGSTLGTMAYQNANSVTITGGAIGGVGITGSNVNNTPIGVTTPSTGKFTSLQATGTTILGTLNGYLKGTSGTVSAVSAIPYSDISGTPTGLSVTITTAKLTTGGANGSMTFTNGILTSQTQAT